ncbi:MAG: hypothetical protein Q8S33_19410 [Myxococcales bacterium]|nr:hypothetical protein [Myxococcales bacterium]
MTLPCAALGEPRSLTVVPHPLEFDPRPELVSVSDKLKGAWIEAVREAGEVVTPSRRELDAALLEVGRKDCRTSNDCLAALAVKGAGLYAVHAMVELTEAGTFVVTARVVRDDGKLMASFTAQQPRGDRKKQLVPVVKLLLVDVIKGLGVKALPTFKEALDAPPPAVVTPPPQPPPVVVAPPVVEPVAAPVAAPVEPVTKTRTVAGFSVMGAGAAVGLAGGVLLFVAQTQARALMVDARGFLPATADADTIARASTANTLHLAGLVGLGVGAASLVAGLVVLLTGPSEASVSFLPIAGGGVAVVGGPLP